MGKTKKRNSFFVLGKIKTNEKRILFSPQKKNERKTNNEKRTKKRKTFRFRIKKNEKQENPPKNNEKSLSPSKKKNEKLSNFSCPPPVIEVLRGNVCLQVATTSTKNL